MNHLSLTAIFFVGSFLGATAQSKKADRVHQIELQRFEAMTTRDTASLSRMLAKDLSYTHSNGLTEIKAEHLQNIASGRIVYKSMQPEKMDIRVHGRAAVVTGIVHVLGLYQGQEFDIRLGYTDAYFKEKGKWKLVAWQSVRKN